MRVSTEQTVVRFNNRHETSTWQQSAKQFLARGAMETKGRFSVVTNKTNQPQKAIKIRI
jgi:uncharacterized protein YhfF